MVFLPRFIQENFPHHLLHMEARTGKKWVRSLKSKLRRKNRKEAQMEAGGSGEQTREASESTQLLGAVPSSPPPSYEHAIAESRLEAEEGCSEGQRAEAKQPKEILIVHKSSKELYKALAAQWGITCKMSDHCRCYDCQSHYFDCEYDRDNENEKTDGGLGAGTPMFISEVMHGTACSIL